jgi:hypothetical protein
MSSIFLRICVEQHALETFLKPFFSPLDLCILRMTCKTLQTLLPNPEMKYDDSPLICVIHAAIYRHHFGLVLWLHDHHFLCSIPDKSNSMELSRALAHIVTNSDDKLAQVFLIERMHMSLSNFIACMAVHQGNLQLLKDCHHVGILRPHPSLLDVMVIKAAELGHIHILIWLKDVYDFKLTEDIIYNACSGGFVETVKWLRANGCPWGSNCVVTAASKGHLEVMKYLYDSRRIRDSRCILIASTHGQLSIVRWFWNHNYSIVDWHECLLRAVRSRRVELTKWFLSNNVIFIWNAYENYIQLMNTYSDREAVQQWFRDNHIDV